MSRYSSAIYGSDYYGQPTSFGFQVKNFVAESTQYKTIRVSWLNSGGAWDRLRLVRSAYGFPAHEADGVVLVAANSGPTAVAPISPEVGDFADLNLVPGFYYYSLFLRSTSSGIKWTRAGDAFGVSVADKDYLGYLLDRLPTVFTSADTGMARNSQLGKFLAIPSFALSEYRSLLDGLLDVNNPDTVPGPLLPSLMTELGFEYEPEIGMRQNRILARNSAYLAKTKGTALGLAGLASSVSGFSSRVRPLTNILLSQNDSSADAAVGSWVATGSALSRVTTVPPPDADTSLSTYSQYSSEINRTGAFSLAATGTTMSMTLGAASPITGGIPVTAGTAYTLSAYFRSAATSRQATLGVQWFSAAGASLSSTTSAALAATTTTTWVRGSYTVTAPTNAFYAAITVSYPTTVANEVQYVDALQFEVGSAATAYRVAREIEVVFTAERVNEVINGGFDTTINGWTATNGTAAYTNAAGKPYDGGQGALALTVTTSPASISRTDLVVDANRPFSAHARLNHPLNNSLSATISVQFFGTGGASLGTFTSASVSNAALLSDWIRPTLITRSPTGALTATLTITVTAAATSVITIDNVIGEHSDNTQDYFDTRNNNGDVIYEGGINTSRTHLYRLLNAKRGRFLDLAANSLPVGAELNVVVAAPRGAP